MKRKKPRRSRFWKIREPNYLRDKGPLVGSLGEWELLTFPQVSIGTCFFSGWKDNWFELMYRDSSRIVVRFMPGNEWRELVQKGRWRAWKTIPDFDTFKEISND